MDPAFEIGDDFLGDLREIDRDERLRLGRDAGECQERIDQAAHAGRRRLHAGEVIAALVAELIGAAHLQAIAERLDFAERFLQIVRRDGGKLFQLAVTALERLVGRFQVFRATFDAGFEFVIRLFERVGSAETRF